MNKFFMSALIISILSVSGCNTLGGFGRDISETGKALDEAAGWSQDQINENTSSTDSSIIESEPVYQ